ncbi:HEAT repeat domain-containing protein [Burkholderia sp. JPY481]
MVLLIQRNAARTARGRTVGRIVGRHASLAMLASGAIALGASAPLLDRAEPLQAWQYQAVLDALRDRAAVIEAIEFLQENGKPDRADRVPSALLDEVQAKLAAPEMFHFSGKLLSAMATLGQGSARFAPVATDSLGSADPRERSASVMLVLAMGGAKFAPHVVPLLRDPAPGVRESAIAGLLSLGEGAAKFAPDIAERLKDPDRYVRASAAKAFEKLGAASAGFAAQIAGLLTDPEPDVRVAAATALGAMHEAGAQYAGQVVLLLADTDPQVRSGAANALGAMGEAGTPFRQKIAALLADPDKHVVASATRMLQAMGRTADVYAFVAADLRGPAPDRFRALEVLNSLATVVAGADEPDGAGLVPDVTRLLGDPAPRVRALAVGALAGIGRAGEKSAPAVALALKDSDPQVRSSAAQTLALMGDAGAGFTADLVALLRDQQDSVQLAAQEALVVIGRRRADIPDLILPLIKVDKVDDIDYRRRVVEHSLRALSRMEDPAGRVAPEVAKLLVDPDAVVRDEAARQLPFMGTGSARFAPALARMMVADTYEHARGSAVKGLVTMAWRDRPLELPQLVAACLESYLMVRRFGHGYRLQCFLMRPLSPQELVLMEWIQRQDPGVSPDPKSLAKDDAIKVLAAIYSLWPIVGGKDQSTSDAAYPLLRARVAAFVNNIWHAQAGRLTIDDVPLLENWISNFERAGFDVQAADLRLVRAKLPSYEWRRRMITMIAGHVAFWLLLLWAYPRWRPVQSFFFWNRWGRRFLGLGYVGLLITYVPWLRRRMFIPFRNSLVQCGALAGFDGRSYFPDSDVIESGGRGAENSRRPLSAALPNVDGQVVLEGESGLGKTVAVQRMAIGSRRIAVLLRATECREGVVAAIQARLKGQVSDESYLRTLIHQGAIDVLIDGLNEATPETRSRIVQFVEESFHGNFIVTTQPMDWERPRTARALTLQPLRADQIETFLVRQWPAIARSATLDEATYGKAVTTYVAGLVADTDDATALRVLSNPMEASIVSELLSRGERPDLLRLVEQRLARMETEFRARENRPFPYTRFAEQVYAWRVSGAPYFDPTGFDAEVSMLVEHKLMVARTVPVRSADATKEVTRWWFRHDRFMEFCLLPAFNSEHGERQRQHVADEAFFGVYELLALKLPDDEELTFWTFLVEKAADTRRNELLNRYTVARRARTLEFTAARDSSVRLVAGKSAT